MARTIPRYQLLNYLCEKQMLLILDNVEQLLAEGPLQANIVELMLEILQRAPGVKLLVTSREALNLQGEWVFEVGGLAFPETEQTERSDEYAAVALFMQRARRASPGLAFNEADLAGDSPYLPPGGGDAPGHRAGGDVVEGTIACGNRPRDRRQPGFSERFCA